MSSLIESTFGKNSDNDKKYYNMISNFGKLSKEETIKKFKNLIISDKKLITEMSSMMEKNCVDGYSWTNEMLRVIKYNEDMITNIDSFIN